MKYISTFELKAKIDSKEPLQIIDTREADKYAVSHLHNAINIPQIDLPDKAHLVSFDVPVVIYCLYGVKSQAPYLFLTEKLKHKNILILEGGIYQWGTDIDPALEIA